MLPPFSVVIPCFNEARRIGETLRRTVDYLSTAAPESELIVVNDGSTDATSTVARARSEFDWRSSIVASRTGRARFQFGGETRNRSPVLGYPMRVQSISPG